MLWTGRRYRSSINSSIRKYFNFLRNSISAGPKYGTFCWTGCQEYPVKKMYLTLFCACVIIIIYFRIGRIKHEIQKWDVDHLIRIAMVLFSVKPMRYMWIYVCCQLNITVRQQGSHVLINSNRKVQLLYTNYVERMTVAKGGGGKNRLLNYFEK